jgi:cell fate regulator YaaT (PSP1 superfamily)
MSHDYLVCYGAARSLGRFRTAVEMHCQRGDVVVVHTCRGVESGQVLCEATPGHAGLFPEEEAGQLLRLGQPEDEQKQAEAQAQAQVLFERASELTQELALPLFVLDTEVLLDGENGAIHYVSREPCDVRPLVSTLSREMDLFLSLVDLTRPDPQPEAGGCGSGGCGSGGCGSGGCGSGGCSSGVSSDEVREYFAQLRAQMERQTAVSLL